MSRWIWGVLIVSAATYYPQFLHTLGLALFALEPEAISQAEDGSELIDAAFTIPFNLSLFEPAVALLGLVLVLRRRWDAVDWKLAAAIATILAAVLAHGATVYLTKEGAETAWLLRETAKLCAAVGMWGVLVLLLRGPGLQQLPGRELEVLLGLLALSFLLIHMADEYTWPGYTGNAPRTIFLLVLLCLLTLLFCRNGDSGTQSFYLHPALLVAMAMVALIMHSKAIFFLSLAAAAACVIRPSGWGRSFGRRHAAKLALGAAVVLAVGLLILGQLGILEKVDGIARSSSIRWLLWSSGLEALAASPFLGIGQGQFATVAMGVPQLMMENHRFMHNVPLTLVVEMGLLGLILLGALVWMLLACSRSLPRDARIVLVLCIGPLFLLHDIHGVRMLILTTAFLFARHLDMARSMPAKSD